MLDTRPDHSPENIPPSWNVINAEAVSDLYAGNQSSFDISVYYCNGLPLPVVLTLRNGLSITIPPNFDNVRYTRDFTIQVRYRCGRGVNLDVGRLLDGVDEKTQSVELKALKSAVSKGIVNPVTKAESFGLDYNIPKKELENNGGVLYVEELDVVVSLGVDGKLPVHPYSTVGQVIRKKHSGYFHRQSRGFLFALEIVDNDGLIGDKFINYGGEVYRVPAVQDPHRVDGYYLYRTPTVHDDGDSTPMEMSRFTHREAASMFAIYQSATEAEAQGDLLAQRDREIKEWEQTLRERQLQHEERAKEKRIEYENLKAQLQERSAQREHDLNEQAQELASRQKELQQVKADLDRQESELKHQREMQSIVRKDEYESRSHARRDSSEMLKWIPHVLVGIGGAILAVKGLGF